MSGTADPDVEIGTFGFHPDVGGFGGRTVTADALGDWTLDLDEVFDPGDRPPEIPDGMVLGGGQSDEDNDRTIMFWDPALVEGRVYLDDVEMVGVEVYLAPDLHTCTDATGYFSFPDASVVHQLVAFSFAATGPAAAEDNAGCTNAEFLDDEGRPLLVAVAAGFDLQDDGYEYIRFDATR